MAQRKSRPRAPPLACQVSLGACAPGSPGVAVAGRLAAHASMRPHSPGMTAVAITPTDCAAHLAWAGACPCRKFVWRSLKRPQECC